VRGRHRVELAVDGLLEKQHEIGRPTPEQSPRLEIADEAREIAGPLVQVPGDDCQSNRPVRDAQRSPGGAAAERQRDRDEDDSSETAV
jgi:hypothetical protein